MREIETVWLALFNPMIHESEYGVLSAHKTKKGAEQAISFHRHELEHIEFGIDDNMAWVVIEEEIKD